MTKRVLCVDDEPSIVQGYRRNLHRQFEIDAAHSGAEALDKLKQNAAYAVIVTDLRMPGMDGIELLTHVRKSAPDVVRIMLTGFADVSTAMEAVNEGHIFRFLSKPCTPEVLRRSIADGLRQHELVTAERTLLNKTLRGAVKVLTEVLALSNPTACSQGTRVRPLVRKLCEQLGVENSWKCEIAAMLSQLGCLTIPPATLEKSYRNEVVTPDEEAMVNAHPTLGASLVAHIPRLEDVAKIIEQQRLRYLGGGAKGDEEGEPVVGRNIELAARVLKAALDYDALKWGGMPEPKVLLEMRTRSGWYDPDVLAALEAVVDCAEKYEQLTVDVRELTTRMVLAEDVVTDDGMLLVSKGQEVTSYMKQRLTNFAKRSRLKDSICVFIRQDGAPQESDAHDEVGLEIMP